MVTKALLRTSFLSLLALLVATPAPARMATPDDSDVVEEKTRIDIEIRADGTFEGLSESYETVRNEAGREKAMHYQRTFNGTNIKLEVLEAKTIAPSGEETKVPKALIETKPLASPNHGFDDLTQVSIAFPAVTVGSKLYRKTRLEGLRPTFSKFFSHRIGFGDEHLVRDVEYRFRSELPLFTEVSDPSKKLQVTRGRDGKKWLLTVKLPGESYERIVDEPSSYLPPDRMTWVLVSTAETHVTMVRAVAPQYETVLAAPLPAPFAAIVGDVKSELSTVDKMNLVTSRLSSFVRYVGDWRAVGGSHVPHTLADIAAKRFGDCKDFSVATVAMLRKLGFQADVAWVYSGFPAYPVTRLPSESSFNHAIVRVKDDTRVYWIDPTHPASFAQGTHENIADRMALIIGGRDGTLEKIPALTPESSVYIRQFNIRPEKERSIAVGARIDLGGRAAVGWTGQALRSSKEALRYSFLNALSGGKPVEGAELEPVDLGGRTVKDFAISGTFLQHNALLQTSMGTAYPLEDSSFKMLMDLAIDDRAGDVLLTHPVRQESTYRLIGAKPSGKTQLGCKLQSRWMDVTRTVARDKQDTVVTDVFELKTAILPIADFRSPSFAEFQRQLRECLYQVAIVFDEKPVKVAKTKPLKKKAPAKIAE